MCIYVETHTHKAAACVCWLVSLIACMYDQHTYIQRLCLHVYICVYVHVFVTASRGFTERAHSQRKH